jgi:hypothetical protein
MDRQAVEHAPNKWRGELDGLHIGHDGDPIPVIVHVTWTDGTEGEVQRADVAMDQVTRVRRA